MDREKKENYMDRLVLLTALLAALLSVCLILWQTDLLVQARMQKKVAQEILRFHVIANSDSERDQAVKLEVRNAVLEYLGDEMPQDMELEETLQWMRGHTPDIEKVSRDTLEEEGADYPVNVAVATCYFPDKMYEDMVFPAGNYEALRIEIGAAQGHNWWCVLYPGLCFGDAVQVSVPEKAEEKEKLKNIVTEEEYSSVTATSDFKISWYFWKGR